MDGRLRGWGEEAQVRGKTSKCEGGGGGGGGGSSMKSGQTQGHGIAISIPQKYLFLSTRADATHRPARDRRYLMFHKRSKQQKPDHLALG